MFETPASPESPRVFATPLGVDFSTALIDGIEARLNGAPPEAIARVEIFVNTERLGRRLRTLLAQRGQGFFPKITPITAIPARPELFGLPPAMSPLGLRLTLSQMILKRMQNDADYAPRSALYQLSDSLADLMGEMQEEGVSPAELAALETSELSDHWKRSKAFLEIAAQVFAGGEGAVTPEMRQVQAVARLEALWSEKPPAHPVLVAGSTGSRGTTFRLMQAVAKLPQGAVILPGADPDLGAETAAQLLRERSGPRLGGEDHPQYRHVRFCTEMGLAEGDLPAWAPDQRPANPARNAWLSLALRPAPVTDAWQREAPRLEPRAAEAFEGVTLLKAPSPQAEAQAIAYRLREAAERGERAALVSPDRMLTRQVSSYLARWGLIPDDSAGEPLDQTPPGRLLAMTAGLLCRPVDAVDLMAILKHPLTNSSAQARGEHLLRARDLELQLLRGKAMHPSASRIADWAAERSAEPDRHSGDLTWAAWIAEVILAAPMRAEAPFAEFFGAHMRLTERIAAGPESAGSGELWEEENGRAARAVIDKIRGEAMAGGQLRPTEYRDMVTAILSNEETRSPLRPDQNVMIWGAMEARVQGADLMILAGLNEGIWPKAEGADPWLSRGLRAACGLRLPDRRVGLSAHDFQQAASAPEVWLCRSVRDADAETVPSRWLNRLMNLMQGAGPLSRGQTQEMEARGAAYLEAAAQLDESGPEEIAPLATRDAPAPPPALRPSRLSVTQIERLIRDPYAIYAEKTLGLRKLDPLRPTPDARLRGTLLHDIVHVFVDRTRDGLPNDPGGLFMEIAQERLNTAEDWPVARHLWLSSLANALPEFLAGEARRRVDASPGILEQKGEAVFDEIDFTLVGKPDRIDRAEDGRVLIYDYKSGAIPSAKMVDAFNKQLHLEAVMAARGAFTRGDPAVAAAVAFVSLRATGDVLHLSLSPEEIAETEAELGRLLAGMRDPSRGFVPRRAMEKESYPSDFEHLARYGEWDDSSEIRVVKVGG